MAPYFFDVRFVDVFRRDLGNDGGPMFVTRICVDS